MLRACVACGGYSPTLRPGPRWGSPEHPRRTAASCAQNGLPAAAAREAQPRRLACPTSLGGRWALRPGLQEALRSNTVFVFLSAAPRNCALSGSHECAAERNVIYREYDNRTGGPLTGGRWVLGDGTESWLP